MKNIIIIILIGVCTACKAQAIYPLGTYNIVESSYYVKDIENHHDDIVGIWRWEEGNNSFEITLQEFEMYQDFFVATQYYDSIFGKYTYIENGNIISEVTTIQTLPNFKLSLIFWNPTTYKVFISDDVSETGKIGEFKLITANTATLRLWNSEGIKLNYGNGQDFALPTSVTLTKQ